MRIVADKLGAPALLLGISLIWGSGWLASQGLRDQGDPLALGAVRYAFAAIALACVAWFVRRRQRAVDSRSTEHRLSAAHALFAEHSPRHSLAVDAILGVSMLAAPYVLLFYAGQHYAGAWTLMLYSAMPLILALAEGELRMPAVLAPCAMLVLLNGSLSFNFETCAWAGLSLAAVLMQTFALLFAVRHLRGMSKARIVRSVAAQSGWAALLVGVASAALEPAPRIAALASWNAPAFASLAALVLLTTAAAYPLYYMLLASYKPSQLAVTQWFQLLIAISESAFLLGEHPPTRVLSAGAVLIVLAVIMLRTSEDNSAASQSLLGALSTD